MDLDARRAWNAERGLERQVVSPWMDVTGDDLDGSQARSWARLLNDGVAAEIEGDPSFLAFATLPVNDGAAAAEELARCVQELGFVGATLPTQVGGRNLSEGGLQPLFEAAESLDVPLFLHPFRILGASRLQQDFMTNICGNPFEITVAAMDLFFSGVIDRYPALAILLSHCGGTLPLVAGRAAHGSRNNPKVRRSVDAPGQILDAFYYDTVQHDAQALAYSIARVGAKRVALGSDVPFPMAVDDPCGHVRHSLELGGLAASYAQVSRGTAEGLVRVGENELH
jgi:Predicted metal-dependent hydrolase of the TIM-barrel fold